MPHGFRRVSLEGEVLVLVSRSTTTPFPVEDKTERGVAKGQKVKYEEHRKMECLKVKGQIRMGANKTEGSGPRSKGHIQGTPKD